MINTFKASEGQTVFDLAINLYTDLDNVINLLQLSNIDNVNESNLNQKVVIYDSRLISDNILYRDIFGKRRRFTTGKIITSITERRLLGTHTGSYIVTNLGYKILV